MFGFINNIDVLWPETSAIESFYGGPNKLSDLSSFLFRLLIKPT